MFMSLMSPKTRYTVLPASEGSTAVSSFVLAASDYVTFGPLLSQIRLSSVTFVRPTLGVES